MATHAGTSSPRAVGRALFWAVWLALLTPASSAGQPSLLVEARGGVSIPVSGFARGPGGGELGRAPAVDLHFGLLQGRRTYVYIGFAQLRTDCSRDGCPSRWVSTQWDAGVRVELSRGAVVPWIRAGVVSPTVENVPVSRSSEPTRPGTSERGWGGEVGAGVRVPLTDRLSLSPGARYVAVDVGRGGAADLKMRTVVVDLGLVVGF